MTGKRSSYPRVAALVGPFASGKTTLLEALLFQAGAISRQGRAADGSTVGDAGPEARARRMSVEPNMAELEYLGESWTLVDCPGSVEFQQDSCNVLAVADAAIVVCEPDPARAVMVAPVLKFLDDNHIPHVLFINKVDGPDIRLKETLEALQSQSQRPLVLREAPIIEGDKVVGYVDLASERAYGYRSGQPSALIRIPDALLDEERRARQEMLEHLADFDDGLMEELLNDVAPPGEEIYADLARDLAGDLIVPVFFGSADSSHGVTRLWKALRHDVPSPETTAARLGLAARGAAAARVFKTVHAAHSGKLSYARILRGEFVDGQSLDGSRLSGLFTPGLHGPVKAVKAGMGEVAAFAKLDDVATGALLGAAAGEGEAWPPALEPLFAVALKASKSGDDVKLTSALAKLAEEDPSYHMEHNAQFGELVLWGRGEIHLQVALDRLRNRFGLSVTEHKPTVPYQETIRKGGSIHGRHKKQSGGHGQFGDVTLEIRPLPRGAGFVFEDKIVGGVIPKQYIPAVEEGAREALRRGPLGFPVADVAATLTQGGFHAVDSSDMAFKTAARQALAEGLAQCEPVLLEPILAVEVSVPADHTSKAQRIISGRRGQILGYDARPGWAGWDTVSAYLPQSEMGDLIVELRSLTMGVGTFSWKFDHLQELTGRLADKVVEARKEGAGSPHP